MHTIFVEKQEMNDATSFYIGIIKSAIEKITEEVKVVSNINEISKNDIVIVVTIKTFFLVWLKNRKQTIYIWFQGILPEENLMMFEGFKKYFKFFSNRILEKLALTCCKKAFFVSNAMYIHYKKEYGYKGNKHFIMPCFNQEISEDCFKDEKYNNPSFVYAGNLAKWQCVDKTLELFKSIKANFPDATITLLTKEKEKALELANEYGINVITVKYVPYTELKTEMSKYKYGFLLREDNAVNNVATPTKMNSYMACGVIPIFSDVIGDFKYALSDVEYKISVSSIDTCIEKLKKIENQKFTGTDVLNDYKKVYSTYYSKENYIEGIVKFLKKE
jgi:glycosyltransferase involved in cell wall biosynthesis